MRQGPLPCSPGASDASSTTGHGASAPTLSHPGGKPPARPGKRCSPRRHRRRRLQPIGSGHRPRPALPTGRTRSPQLGPWSHAGAHQVGLPWLGSRPGVFFARRTRRYPPQLGRVLGPTGGGPQRRGNGRVRGVAFPLRAAWPRPRTGPRPVYLMRTWINGVEVPHTSVAIGTPCAGALVQPGFPGTEVVVTIQGGAVRMMSPPPRPWKTSR